VTAFLAGRLLTLLPVLWGVSVVVFLLIHLLPGDALQIFLFPLFGEGFASPVNDLLDMGVALALVRLVGFHWVFLPSLVAEAVPGLDLAPTWTAAVLVPYASWFDSQHGSFALTDYTGHFLYGRVADFVRCDRLHVLDRLPPPCPTRPPGPRPAPTWPTAWGCACGRGRAAAHVADPRAGQGGEHLCHRVVHRRDRIAHRRRSRGVPLAKPHERALGRGAPHRGDAHEVAGAPVAAPAFVHDEAEAVHGEQGLGDAGAEPGARGSSTDSIW